MSMILGKYKNKRRLGKGAYGDVLLVEDPNGKEVAIKMISKKIFQKDPFMEEYLEGEKECMKTVKSQYVMELLDFEEDENYQYFICEYCDGGDLLNAQAKQPNKVFELKKATEIMAEVIHGLELLHSMGYLHRDIKSQNILLKKDPKNEGKYHYKLADFGFAKKHDEVGGTVLGTEHYMSPEVFFNEVYGFEVDMWAFGVLLYFMLNMEFPFRLNPHSPIQQKREDLIKQAKTFNYTEMVKKSKKKVMENCTPQVDDLFSKIFTVDGNERINFADIRSHPLFVQYFPEISNQSKILYKGKNKMVNKLDSFIQGKMSGIQQQPKGTKKPNLNKTEPDRRNNNDVDPGYQTKRANTSEEKNYLVMELDKIQFLHSLEEDISVNFNSFMTTTDVMPLRYNLLKYYHILLSNFLKEITVSKLEQKKPNLKWKEFSKTDDFKAVKRDVEKLIDNLDIEISNVYDQCRGNMTAIEKINPQFPKICEPSVTDDDFSGPFKASYRESTGRAFMKVREKFGESGNGNLYPYMTTIITLCHGFNYIMDGHQEDIENTFAQFVEKKGLKGKQMDFTNLKAWLSQQPKDKLKPIMKSVFKYFGQ